MKLYKNVVVSMALIVCAENSYGMHTFRNLGRNIYDAMPDCRRMHTDYVMGRIEKTSKL